MAGHTHTQTREPWFLVRLRDRRRRNCILSCLLLVCIYWTRGTSPRKPGISNASWRRRRSSIRLMPSWKKVWLTSIMFLGIRSSKNCKLMDWYLGKAASTKSLDWTWLNLMINTISQTTSIPYPRCIVRNLSPQHRQYSLLQVILQYTRVDCTWLDALERWPSYTTTYQRAMRGSSESCMRCLNRYGHS